MKKQIIKQAATRFTTVSLCTYTRDSHSCSGIEIRSVKRGNALQTQWFALETRAENVLFSGIETEYRYIAEYLNAHPNALPMGISTDARAWKVEQVELENARRAAESAAFDWTEAEQAAG